MRNFPNLLMEEEDNVMAERSKNHPAFKNAPDNTWKQNFLRQRRSSDEVVIKFRQPKGKEVIIAPA